MVTLLMNNEMGEGWLAERIGRFFWAVWRWGIHLDLLLLLCSHITTVFLLLFSSPFSSPLLPHLLLFISFFFFFFLFSPPHLHKRQPPHMLMQDLRSTLMKDSLRLGHHALLPILFCTFPPLIYDMTKYLSIFSNTIQGITNSSPTGNFI